MKTKYKSSLLLGLTLLIGIIIGFLIKSFVVESKFEKMGRLTSSSGLLETIDEVVNLSAEQKEKIDPLLANYQQKFYELRSESGLKIRALVDSMKSDMQITLTQQQYEDLSKHRMFSRRSNYKKRHKLQRDQHDSLKDKSKREMIERETKK